MQVRMRAHDHLLTTAADLSPLLRETIVAAGPLWFPRRRTRDLALFLSRSVVGQQLSVAAARTIWGRLEQGLGTRGKALPDRCRPGVEPRLCACGVSRAKARTLIEIRRAKRSGLLDEAASGRDQASRDQLLRGIWGVGQWTCDMVSIFYCKEPDVWPVGDVSVQRAFRTVLGEDMRGLDDIQQRFSPYRSILSLHLYRYLDNPVT